MKGAIGLSALCRRAWVVRRNATFKAPRRLLIITQSDDWGRTGMPERMCLGCLRAACLTVGKSPWDRFGFETAEDLKRFDDDDNELPRQIATMVGLLDDWRAVRASDD
jgi:hypothetical protein